ncbi:hypothetical protein Peur_004347 [Populus x canadensis]
MTQLPENSTTSPLDSVSYTPLLYVGNALNVKNDYTTFNWLQESGNLKPIVGSYARLLVQDRPFSQDPASPGRFLAQDH